MAVKNDIVYARREMVQSFAHWHIIYTIYKLV